MHEPGDRIIVGDSGLAVSPGLHTLFDIAYTVVSTNWAFTSFVTFITAMQCWRFGVAVTTSPLGVSTKLLYVGPG